jgi:hypothetical protein
VPTSSPLGSAGLRDGSVGISDDQSTVFIDSEHFGRRPRV